MAPFISVIIPTFNRPAQLHQCLEAAARLNYPTDRFEVLVVDDGSSAPLDEVISRFRNRIDLKFLTQRNSGPGAARNAGARRAKGSLLAFTDDDCRPAPDWLKKLAAHFLRVPDCALGGKTINALDTNLYSKTSQAIIDFVYSYYNADYEYARFFASNNLAVPADRFASLGGFHPHWPRVASEDREFCDRWLHAGYRMIYASDAIVYHSHWLTFRTFWQLHFNYGRGAFHFHRVRSQRRSGSFGPELRFYCNLARHRFIQLNGARVLPLLALWQVANAAGFCREWIGAWREASAERLEAVPPRHL